MEWGILLADQNHDSDWAMFRTALILYPNPIYLSSRERISLTAAESSTKWKEGTIASVLQLRL